VRPLDDARARDRLARALEILNPPEAEWDSWVERVRAAFALLETPWNDAALDAALRSKETRAALERLASALREMRASYVVPALAPLRDRKALEIEFVAREIEFVAPLSGELTKTTEIEIALLNVEMLLKQFGDRPRHAPVKRRERAAAEIARRLLKLRGVKLTVSVSSEWHLLTQVLADTRRNLVRYLKVPERIEQLLDRHPELRAHHELHRKLERAVKRNRKK
jgi:hypothetical protein